LWAATANAQFISQRFLPEKGERGRIGESLELRPSRRL